MDESLPHKWFHRRGFYKARMLVLFTWLFFGNVLSMGYKSTLLSTLIPIREAPNMTSKKVEDINHNKYICTAYTYMYTYM